MTLMVCILLCCTHTYCLGSMSTLQHISWYTHEMHLEHFTTNKSYPLHISISSLQQPETKRHIILSHNQVMDGHPSLANCFHFTAIKAQTALKLHSDKNFLNIDQPMIWSNQHFVLVHIWSKRCTKLLYKTSIQNFALFHYKITYH